MPSLKSLSVFCIENIMQCLKIFSLFLLVSAIVGDPISHPLFPTSRRLFAPVTPALPLPVPLQIQGFDIQCTVTNYQIMRLPVVSHRVMLTYIIVNIQYF